MHHILELRVESLTLRRKQGFLNEKLLITPVQSTFCLPSVFCCLLMILILPCSIFSFIHSRNVYRALAGVVQLVGASSRKLKG